MKVCLDVDYRSDHGMAAAVLFTNWTDEHPNQELVQVITDIEPYIPGQFYRRELPCLLGVLQKIHQPIDLIIVDGYVWLGDESHPGLGGHLFAALGRTIPVIGVAKTCFRSATLAVAVSRGELASKPLHVTAAGMDVQEVAKHIASMHGPYRLPTLLKRVDSLSRTASFPLMTEVTAVAPQNPVPPDEPV